MIRNPLDQTFDQERVIFVKESFIRAGDLTIEGFCAVFGIWVMQKALIMWVYDLLLRLNNENVTDRASL
ncbi:hypothetical protein N780_19905 [Pontibacillus chungwhensis BH030062]|uniref:Uncharacterized protein n=1 Tax=Pontibacillus chungwhensis BH030062 TaxID=1385513 RepID=A0A0A2UT90_9BACI|nr:hypothetical protein N780_19905 [Pontibacillus chungwhensis BH030062]